MRADGSGVTTVPAPERCAACAAPAVRHWRCSWLLVPLCARHWPTGYDSEQRRVVGRGSPAGARRHGKEVMPHGPTGQGDA
jgi:hypothetical protein